MQNFNYITLDNQVSKKIPLIDVEMIISDMYK